MAKRTPVKDEAKAKAEAETEAKDKDKDEAKRIEGDLELLRVIGDDGQADEQLEPKLSDKQLKELYRWMVLARTFDQRALNLQRQGRMYTYAPVSGQEAAQVGSAYALKSEDWTFPTYREHAVAIVRGIPLKAILLVWMGNEEGNRIPEDINHFTPSVPIATQIVHAVGVAWAAKLRGDKAVTLAYFGDGATSEGDFHEGANFAGVFKTPTVFFCQNNQYAISVPRERQTAAETLAQKANAYGFEGVRVDGNDILAVYRVTHEAVEQARAGGGPTLIEAVTYRFGPHTTSDDPTRYRSAEELEEWQQRRDPIERFRRYLEGKGLWSEAYQEELGEAVKAEVANAVEEAEAAPKRDIEEIFKYVYAEMPWILEEELDAFRKLQERFGTHEA
ncbi:MAG: pyruvate dehydrogenase (acetyl-transferring) E1 component subunit alpha [Candidatus Bipolaricaulia bacterium]